MTIKLAFQKDLKKGSSLRDHVEAGLIKWWTSSEYFHVEMIIDGYWISSNPKYGGVAVRALKPLDEELYDYVEVDVDGRKISRVLAWLKSQEGSKYDWAGIWFGQVLGTTLEHKNKWFCSELVAHTLRELGIELRHEAVEYNPQNLLDEIELGNFCI